MTLEMRCCGKPLAPVSSPAGRSEKQSRMHVGTTSKFSPWPSTKPFTVDGKKMCCMNTPRKNQSTRSQSTFTCLAGCSTTPAYRCRRSSVAQRPPVASAAAAAAAGFPWSSRALGIRHRSTHLLLSRGSVLGTRGIVFF